MSLETVPGERNTLLKNRLIALAALLGIPAVLIVAWIIRGDSGFGPTESTLPAVANTVEISERGSPNSSASDTGGLDSTSAAADARSGKPSAMDLPRQEAWERAHGYMSSDTMHLENLDEGRLRELIAQGTTAAITILAGRYLTIDPRKMMELYEQAAVPGSTSALVSASSSAWASPWISENVSTMSVPATLAHAMAGQRQEKARVGPEGPPTRHAIG